MLFRRSVKHPAGLIPEGQCMCGQFGDIAVNVNPHGIMVEDQRIMFAEIVNIGDNLFDAEPPVPDTEADKPEPIRCR